MYSPSLARTHAIVERNFSRSSASISTRVTCGKRYELNRAASSAFFPSARRKCKLMLAVSGATHQPVSHLHTYARLLRGPWPQRAPFSARARVSSARRAHTSGQRSQARERAKIVERYTCRIGGFSIVREPSLPFFGCLERNSLYKQSFVVARVTSLTASFCGPFSCFFPLFGL